MRWTVSCAFLGSLFDVESCSRSVSMRWCRFLRCRVLLRCRRLLLVHSESADSVVVGGSISSAWVGLTSVHTIPSDHLMLSPSCCSNPLYVLPRCVKVQDRLSESIRKLGDSGQQPSVIVTSCVPASHVPSKFLSICSCRSATIWRWPKCSSDDDVI